MVRKAYLQPSAPTLMIVIALFLGLTLTGVTQAQTESLLYSFGSNGDGSAPSTPVISDSSGNLYGTTAYGGTVFAGTVFKLTKNSGSWTESLLYIFAGGKDGSQPGGLVFDGSGNLYGTTSRGGAHNVGTIYKLTPTASGPWKKTILFNFSPSAGGFPPTPFFSTAPTIDAAGNLFGITAYGIKHPQGGTVWRLSANTNGTWSHSVLYEFTGGADGQFPADRKLLIDDKGNVFGTAMGGGTYGAGLIFKLTPTASGLWTETILHTFTGLRDGGGPNGSLISDKAGNLYGMTSTGGSVTKCYPGCGVIFKLSPTASGPWTEQELFTFQNGDTPYGGLVFDPSGNLYGTTYSGGIGSGTVFKLTPATTGPWTETVLHAFSGPPADGQGPLAGLLRDAAGHLYGTTYIGGANFGGGAVFEVTP